MNEAIQFAKIVFLTPQRSIFFTRSFIRIEKKKTIGLRKVTTRETKNFGLWGSLQDFGLGPTNCFDSWEKKEKKDRKEKLMRPWDRGKKMLSQDSSWGLLKNYMKPILSIWKFFSMIIILSEKIALWLPTESNFVICPKRSFLRRHISKLKLTERQ